MSRVEENKKHLDAINSQLTDKDMLAEIILHPEKSQYLALTAMLPLMADISESLAVIADALKKE